MGEQCTNGGRRRRHTKKHRRSRRRHTRRGGFAPAGIIGTIPGQSGQPAGADFRAIGVSGGTPDSNASNYGGAPSTAVAYGGRRRSRRGRKSRRSRYRMRGGGGTGGGGELSSRIFAGYGGESVGGNAPGAAVREAAPAGVQG